MSDIKIGLVQMRCEKAAIDQNSARIEEYLRAGLARGVDFLCFPEMSITGYIDPAKYSEAIIRLDGPEVARVVELTCGNNVVLMAGLVEENPHGKPFITQIVAQGGKLLGFYRKITIINEEVPWFSPGIEVSTFAHPASTFGLSVCADIDNPAVFVGNREAGAKIIFEAAAPGLYGSQENRNWQSGFEWWQGECRAKLGRYARENGVYIAVATQAGRTIDEDFPGGGYLFGPDGTCLAASEDWSPGVLFTQITL